MNNNFNSINFFYSANSEAYQDAFLTWIFYNFYNDNSLEQSDIEVKNFSKFMLKELVKLKNDDEIITEVEPDTQVKNSDIILNITTNKNIYLVIIEDKTGSSIHPSNKENGESYQTQLEKYYDIFMEMDKYTNLFKEGRVFLYYYKNEYVNSYEKRVLAGANSRLLKNVYERKIKKCEKNIEDAKKDIEEANQDKGKDHHIKIKNREETIKENESQKNKLESEYNDLESRGKTKSLCEWEIFGIDDIYDLFDFFLKDNKIADFENIILRDYYQSIKFWHEKYQEIENNGKMLLYGDKPDFLWEEQSQIWNSIFEKVMKKVIKESSEKRYVVNKYNGNYWQGSLISDNNVTCLLISPRKIVKDNNTVKIDITLNLRNEKYNDEVPWRNKKERENHRVAIVEKLNKSLGEGWVINQKPKKDEDDDRNDTNLLATYSVSVESSKATVDFLSDAFNTTIKDLKCIEEYTVNNQKQKIFI